MQLQAAKAMNFTEHGMDAPTWINVMREPISWFESRYWFKQNGWVHKVGARLHENHSEDERVDIELGCYMINYHIWPYRIYFKD